ncbi:hypothetical protein, partial [Salmonella sp. s55004]|uniref:hypothetical protein n=1 Tax=Salmonella sp. s55004 TaxID=3159675 RepID=UPI00397EACEE
PFESKDPTAYSSMFSCSVNEGSFSNERFHGIVLYIDLLFLTKDNPFAIRLTLKWGWGEAFMLIFEIWFLSLLLILSTFPHVNILLPKSSSASCNQPLGL